MIGAAPGVGEELPSLRFHEKRDGDKRVPNDHQVKDVNSLCSDLFEHLSLVSTLLWPRKEKHTNLQKRHGCRCICR